MRRHAAAPRDGYEQIIQNQGLVYNTIDLPDGSTRQFWNESAYYSFSLDEVLRLEQVTQELQRICLEAVDFVITHRRFHDFAIPEFAWPAITQTWEADSPSVYGRFDLRYDGHSAAKLLEYNADTPTSLLEAAVIQWYWLADLHPDRDQWNSLHERLIAAWQRHAPRIADGRIHFTYTGQEMTGEDLMTVTYLRETANQAGLSTETLAIEEVGWDHEWECFVDPNREPLTTIFKLYPWEWMFTDEFGERAVRNLAATGWIEPTWKCVLSNKAILAILWELFPNHPNLLPAYLSSPGYLTSYVQKPILGREGANVQIVTPGGTYAQEGPYGQEGSIFQEYAPLPDFDGNHPVVGSWVVDGEPAGMGIRESDTLITDNTSSFVPHLIDSPRQRSGQ